MEPLYSNWKYVIKADNRKDLLYCPTCQRPIASLMHRYVTGRDGERYEQFRVECPICQKHGVTYQNRNVAVQSWSTRENEPKPPVQRGRPNAK